MRVAPRLPTCVVLDIEGTVAPITFVKQILFPYAKSHVRSFLESTYDSPETKEVIQKLAEQAEKVCLGSLCMVFVTCTTHAHQPIF